MTTDLAGHVPELTLGWRMQMALREGGVGVGEIAEQLGVDRNTVGRWTADKFVPKRAFLLQWALITGVPIEWIETGHAPSGDDGGGDGLPRLDSNQQPSGYRSRRGDQHGRLLAPLLVA